MKNKKRKYLSTKQLLIVKSRTQAAKIEALEERVRVLENSMPHLIYLTSPHTWSPPYRITNDDLTSVGDVTQRDHTVSMGGGE